MGLFLVCPESKILLGHLLVVVMLLHIFYALSLEFRDTFRMKHQLFQFITDAFVSRLYIDDRMEFGFVDDLVVFWLPSTDADNPL